MKRFSGGDVVPGGYYWHLTNWEIIPVRKAKGALPGAAADQYLELPLPALPIVVTVMATLNVFFVPAIGFIMVGYAGYKKVAGREQAPAKDVVVKPP